MTTATAIGSWPGDDATAYAEAVRTVFGELPDLPHIPELPGRGATASMTGRTLALVGLDADLQPAGWRLTGSSGSPGMDHRRARSLLAQDLDTLEEQAQDFEGRFKVQVTGPWTLAATVEKPRGDRILSDHGARRDLAQALAEGVAEHVEEVRKRVPGATELLVQVDEPALPAVLAGQVPTASGFHRHRSVDLPLASALLEEVFAAVAGAGAIPIAHCCAADVPVSLLTGAGAQGVSVDLGVLAVAAYDDVATLLEKGAPVLLGVVPSSDPATPPGEKALVEKVLRFLEMLGLDPESTPGLVVTPTCGLAGATAGWAREALKLSHKVAQEIG